MTRDDARAAFINSGLTSTVLDKASTARLRRLMDVEMKHSGMLRGSFRIAGRTVKKTKPDGIYLQIRCDAHYFEGREAVSFEPNGFVGFAGWAAEDVVQPVLEGFRLWLEEISEKTSGAGRSGADHLRADPA